MHNCLKTVQPDANVCDLLPVDRDGMRPEQAIWPKPWKEEEEEEEKEEEKEEEEEEEEEEDQYFQIPIVYSFIHL